jgi:hypothetical protein
MSFLESVRKKLAIVALLLGLLSVPESLAYGADDFLSKHRLSVSLWEQGDWEVQLHGETRWQENSTRLTEWLVTPQVYWKANEHWRFGLAYTHLEIRNSSGFNNDHRLEIEADPHWKLAHWVNLDLRNRMEIRFREGPANGTERYRGRVQFTFPMEHMGPLHSLYANNEFFLDLDSHQYNQNRLTPLGLSFKLNDLAQFRIYYLLQSTRTHAEWEQGHTLGTQLLFRLK